MAIQQRIIFIILRRARRAGTGEQYIIWIGLGRVAGGLFRLIHSAAREQRFVGFAAHRVCEFFSNTLTAGQCATQDAGTTRFARIALRHVIFVFVFFFVFVFIDPGIVATGTIAGKGENIEDPTAHFLSDADPGPAGKQRQARRPNTQQRNGAAAAMEHGL